MRRDLAAPVAAPVWPEDVALRPFTPGDARAVHALLQAAYANGGGTVETFTAWSADSLVGVAQCWTSAFVKDLAVDPGWRRHGVATALLLTAFRAFRDRGARSVDLKVQADNAGAIRVYENLGMAVA